MTRDETLDEMNAPPTVAENIVRVVEPHECCDDAWEAAYRRFETTEEETAKFLKRLREMGASSWPRDARIVSLFCGRGNCMVALEQLGFTNLEGVDLSESLLLQYQGSAKCYVADCRQLPFPDESKDVAIIQGGLHHLPSLPADLEQTLGEVARILAHDGRLVVVEPWLTPFLSIVHLACRSRVARRAWPRLDALATMIEHERETYEQWLDAPASILEAMLRSFEPVRLDKRWGKLHLLAKKRHDGRADDRANSPR